MGYGLDLGRNNLDSLVASEAVGSLESGIFLNNAFEAGSASLLGNLIYTDALDTFPEVITPYRLYRENGNMILDVYSFPEMVYQLQKSSSLKDPVWEDVGESAVGDGDLLQFKDELVDGMSDCFYRILAVKE